MKKHHAAMAGLAAIALFLCPHLARSEEPAGVIKTVRGETALHRRGEPLAPFPGMTIFPGDRLSTGGDGSLGIVFRDDSILTLGNESDLELEEFTFAPARGVMGIVARIARGTVSYLSGLIGKLSPESVRFETPEASIGIRGTHFAVLVQPEK